MNGFGRWIWSSIGAKVIMAITGFLLFLFIIGHMVGNLLVFAGPMALNTYAHKLRELGGLLWVVRFGMLVIFLVHAGMALRLWRLNRSARPIPYEVSQSQVTTYAAQTIVWSGLLILAYLIYHLLHFTLGVTNPEYLSLLDSQGRPNVYAMVLRGFSNPLVSGTYIVAVILLGLHLSHALSSAFQTLGINHPNWKTVIERLGVAAAVIITLAYISIPLAVLSGLLNLP